MAISNIAEYSHLTPEDVEAIGKEFDSIRREVEAHRGERDARYIKNSIRFQRTLSIIGRLALLRPRNKKLFWLGTGVLGIAKIIENMELGHNIMHGQWDWMNDPEIHSSTWEWDTTGQSKHWKYTHNYIHHKYTNIVDVDDDIGYGILRVTRDQPWRLFHAFNIINNVALTLAFQFGVALQHLEIIDVADGLADREEFKVRAKEAVAKMARQMGRDYIAFPLLAGRKGFGKAALANMYANIIRNIWTNVVIFCGHFPDGAEKFLVEDLENETQAEWYLRQMLGSANFSGGKIMSFMSGNLNYQIEHHIFPDLPSNHYAAIAKRVQAVCEKYDLPYTTGSLGMQYLKSWRTIAKLSLPSRFLLKDTTNAPETSSELRFYHDGQPPLPVTQTKQGLRSALQNQGKSGGIWLKNLFSKAA